MPEKQFQVNHKNYLLSFGDGQEEQIDQLIDILNKRITPYASRFSEYSESYLMLLLALEMAHELETSKNQSNNSDSTRETQLQLLAKRADLLVKKAQ